MAIQAIAEKVLDAPPPPRGSALRHLYSGKIDPTSDAFLVAPDFNGEPRTMVDEINLTLAERCAATPTFWSSAKTWPTAAGEKTSPR